MSVTIPATRPSVLIAALLAMSGCARLATVEDIHHFSTREVGRSVTIACALLPAAFWNFPISTILRSASSTRFSI